MKSAVKLIVEMFAALTVLPAFALYKLDSLFFGARKSFPGWSQLLSLIPGLTGTYLRRAFYRMVCHRCDAGATIEFGTIFSHSTCSIGRNTYIGAYCVLGDITLEDEVLIGSHVSIMNGSAQHGIECLDVPIRDQPGVWPRVLVGRDTWIGDRAIVMADVGSHCVIGAGSVVTNPIPDYAIAVGAPARIIRYRTASETATQCPELYFDKSISEYKK